MADDLAEILPLFPADCQPIGPASPVHGGFSGSRLWRFDGGRGQLCLRQWPAEHPDAAQLSYIHDVLLRAASVGFSMLPLPVSARRGGSFVKLHNRLWELAPWISGVPMPDHLAGTPEAAPYVQRALRLAAQFHRAASTQDLAYGPAPGVRRRLEQTESLISGGLQQLASAVAQHAAAFPTLADRATELFELAPRAIPTAASALRHATTFSVPIQPCIRDIHREHVLFQGVQSTGIIDFGALRDDSVAGDVARLMGSLALDNADLWQTGLAAYRQARPLSGEELSLVRAYDQSTVLLSGLNWLRWVFVEHRRFENHEGILARFDEITARLAILAAQSAAITV